MQIEGIEGKSVSPLCEEGEVDVPLFDARAKVEIEDFVSAAGTVSKYKERLQIQIGDPEDIKIAEVVWGTCKNGRIETGKNSFSIN